MIFDLKTSFIEKEVIKRKGSQHMSGFELEEYHIALGREITLWLCSLACK
jgi:hypothetical protein